MSDRRGFVLIDVLMEGVVVIGVLAMVAIGCVQVGKAFSSMAETRKEALYEALRLDLEELRARQALHFADELTYTASLEELKFTSAADASMTVEASGWGWSAAATHPSLEAGAGCAIYLGHAVPPDAPVTPRRPGEVACTD